MQNKIGFVTVVAFLLAIATQGNVFSQDFSAKLSNGKVKPTDATLYINSEVTAGGTVNLLEGIKQSEVGITNFDGQELAKNKYFAISEITINYGVAAAGTSPSAVDYVTAIPAGLKAAEFTVRQGDTVIFKMPIQDIYEAKSTDNRYRDLGGFQLLVDQTNTEVLISFPKSASLNAGEGNASFVQVLFKGYETLIK